MHLNTSHVKVNLLKWLKIIFLSMYLNTSHVKVNQEEIRIMQSNRDTFKYISC